MIDDIVEGSEDYVRGPVLAHGLPDVLPRLQFRALVGNRDQRDVGWVVQVGRKTPSRLIDQKRRMRAGRDVGGDLGRMEAHRFGVGPGHDERRSLSVFGTDSSEDIGGRCSLVPGAVRARAALGPTPGDLVVLADARLVREPCPWRAVRGSTRLARPLRKSPLQPKAAAPAARLSNASRRL